MKICIDVDDYHTAPRWDCTDVFYQILERHTGAKFTVFFTPLMEGIPLTAHPEALDRVHALLRSGHLEVFGHGLTHKKFLNGEFGSLPKAIAGRRIDRAFALFREASVDCGKGFKFPWNMYSRGALRALEERGCMLFSNKVEREYGGRQAAWVNHGKIMKRYIQTGDYRYGIPLPPGPSDIVYYHGHAQSMRSNGMRESCANLLKELDVLKIRAELEYVFCSDRSIFSEFE
jgi:hypothetical protein